MMHDASIVPAFTRLCGATVGHGCAMSRQAGTCHERKSPQLSPRLRWRSTFGFWVSWEVWLLAPGPSQQELQCIRKADQHSRRFLWIVTIRSIGCWPQKPRKPLKGTRIKCWLVPTNIRRSCVDRNI